jgi:penicillin-binding protein 1A
MHLSAHPLTGAAARREYRCRTVHLLGRTLWRLARLALILVVGVTTLGGSVVALGPAGGEVRSSTSSYAGNIQLPPLGGVSLLYDRYGNVQQSFNRELRTVVPLSAVPVTVVESVLAVEDSNFYQHGPVDARSILRALQTNVQSGEAAQGGSTITQQVVKKVVTGDKRDLQRKLHEARTATTLEQQLTKDQILQYYLNLVYFGNNVYGVQAAAQTDWGVDVGQLDGAQGALPAALTRKPNGYHPITHPEAARAQRKIALGRLVTTGRLSKADAAKANLEPLPTKLTQSVPVRDYFVEEVRRRLLNKNGAYDDTPEGKALGKTYAERYNALNRGGLRIYTTYDPLMERKAVDARQQTVPGIQPDGKVPKGTWLNPATGKEEEQWATETISSVEPSTGAVRVLLGGPSYTSNQQDIATQSFKQPGSSFKTFVLTALFERGFVPDDVVDGTSPCLLTPDDPNYIDPTRPTAGAGAFPAHNFGGEGGGVGTITSQTLESSNCGFARLGQIVGLRNVVTMAKSMGISNPIWNAFDPLGKHANDMNPYSVIQAYGGTNGVHALDMAAAYATLANDGVQNDAYLVDRIEDASGHVIWTHKLAPKRVMKAQTARLVNSVLEQNVQGGTGTAARLGSGQPAAGKTGTTDDAINLWFVGYTPQLSTAVWIGDGGSHETNMFNSGATGGAYAAVSWGAFMGAALDGQPIVPFIKPAPTRPGIGIGLGDEDGMTFAARYGYKAGLAEDGTPLGGGTPTPPPPPTSTDGTGDGSQPPATTAPPITAYAP